MFDPNVMHRIHFDTLGNAVEHAKEQGGWIYLCEDGDVVWFHAAKWTRGQAMAVVRKTGRIGPWTDFVEPCPYCGGQCTSEPHDSPNLCDGYAGDFDDLVDAAL